MGIINKGKDNFFHHGLAIGLSLLPLAIWGNLSWILLVVRALALGFAMGKWCDYFSKDTVEECGRGAFIGLTLFIFYLPITI